MELKNIDQIGEKLVVFMPSGIQATLTKNEDKVFVEYPEMYKDEYTHEAFKELIEEGIFIFNEPSIVMESVEDELNQQKIVETIDELTTLMQKIEECSKDSILNFNKHSLQKQQNFNEGAMDKLNKKGYLRQSLVEAYKQQDCEEGSVYAEIKDREKEHVTAEDKNNMLDKLNKIAKNFPDVKVRQQALTFVDELGLQEYCDLEAVRKFIDKNLDKVVEHNAVNEEYGPFKGNIELEVVAKELANGNKSGKTGDLGNWICETSLDEKWETLSLDAKEYILENISWPVKDGHIYYDDLELVVTKDSLPKEDILSLDLFDEDFIEDLFNDEKSEVCAYIWYEIKFDGTIDEGFKVKKKSKKKIADSLDEDIYVVDEEGNEIGPFVDQEAKEEFLKAEQRAGHTEYTELIKENIEEDKMQTNVKEFYCNKYPSDELGLEINPDITFEDVVKRMQDKEDIYDILGVEDSIVRERVFDDISRVNGMDLYDLWLQESLKECLHEEHYRVYNTMEDTQPVTFFNWDEVDAFLNRTWGEYKASMAKDNAEFGTDQDKEDFLANFEVAIEPITISVEDIPAEGMELPVVDEIELTPEEEAEAEQVEQEIEDAVQDLDMEIEQSDEIEPQEVKQEETIEEDLEDPQESDMEVEKTQEEEPIEEEPQVETPQQALDVLDDVENAIESMEDYIKSLVGDVELEESLDTIAADANAYLWDCCAAGGYRKIEELVKVYSLEEMEQDFGKIEDANVREYVKDIVDNIVKNEDFSDNMGLTDIKDVDMPDAIADTIDAKEDGTLYKLSDLAKEIQEFKAAIQAELETIKNDIKTALQDVKQDIKIDVNDVENKVDDTKDAVDDLAVEQDDMADMEAEDIMEEPQEEKTEEEKDEEAYEESLQGNKIFEACKLILTTKMSLTKLAEKLQEHGIKADLNSAYGKHVFQQVADMVSHTSLKESILDPQEEAELEKHEKLGKAAKWLGGGLMCKLLQEKQDKQYEEINAIKQEVDKMSREGKDAKAVKDMITLRASDDKEQKEAEDYAVSKMAEAFCDDSVNALKRNLLATASKAKLNEIKFN